LNELPAFVLAFRIAVGGVGAAPEVVPVIAAGDVVYDAAAAQPRADPPRDAWFAEDKLKHYFMSLAATNLAYGGARLVGLERRPALFAAAGAAGAAGLWKEWYDHHRGRPFSVRDLVWDAAGVATGVVAMRATR
jgi:uncharacterized protein YfiM (DUF2279 family)